MKFIICSQDCAYYTYLCEYEELQSKYKYFIEASRQASNSDEFSGRGHSFSMPYELSPIKIIKVVAELSDSTYDLVNGNNKKLIKHSRSTTEDAFSENSSIERKFRINTEKRIHSIIKDFLMGYKLCMLHEPILKDLVFEADTYDEAIKKFKKIVFNLEFHSKNFSNSYRTRNSLDTFSSKYLAHDAKLKTRPLGFRFNEISILNNKFITLDMEPDYASGGSYGGGCSSIAHKWGAILSDFPEASFSLEVFEKLLDIVSSYKKIDGVMYDYSILYIPQNLCALQLFNLDPYEFTTESSTSLILDDFIKNNTYEEFIKDNSRYLIDKYDVENVGKQIPEFLRNTGVEYTPIVKE